MARNRFEEDQGYEPFMTPKRIFLIVAGILLFIGLIIVPSELLVRVKTNEIVVKQGADGKYDVWTTPGIYWQNFGNLTSYSKSAQYWFSAKADEGDAKDQSIKVRFNDGGHGNISGSLMYNMPLDTPSVLKIHSTFGSQEALEKRLISQTVNKAVYMTGPLMSSKESAGERRADLLNYVADQISRGVYVTETKDVQVPDMLAGEEEVVEVTDVPALDENGKPKLDKDGKPIMTKEAHKVKKARMKTVTVVQPKLNDKGVIDVQGKSPLEEFGIVVPSGSVSISSIAYDPQVEEQIKQQQQALMAVQTAIANAKKAEQDRLTVEKQGEAEAAKAKWAQEVKKATAITEAEQKKSVAQLDLDRADLEKQAKIKLAEGDAEARKLVMAADGALEKKLAAYVEVQKAYADVLGKQPLVPQIAMGGGSSGGGQGANIMDLLQAKTARDLALDLGVHK